MTDIAEWLLAQYDADGRRAEDLHDRRTCDMYSYDPKCCDCDYPDELRDDLAAKRRIVERCVKGMRYYGDYDGEPYLAEEILGLLALPYADRDGYDERWRPEQ